MRLSLPGRAGQSAVNLWSRQDEIIGRKRSENGGEQRHKRRLPYCTAQSEGM